MLPATEENTSTPIQCVIDSVKPGLGSVVFTVTVASKMIVESVDSKLSEESSESGTVCVTYSDTLSLQRKHNRQQAVCTVVWRDGEETVTSESVTVDVLCKYFYIHIYVISGRVGMSFILLIFRVTSFFCICFMRDVLFSSTTILYEQQVK